MDIQLNSLRMGRLQQLPEHPSTRIEAEKEKERERESVCVGEGREARPQIKATTRSRNC